MAAHEKLQSHNPNYLYTLLIKLINKRFLVRDGAVYRLPPKDGEVTQNSADAGFKGELFKPRIVGS